MKALIGLILVLSSCTSFRRTETPKPAPVSRAHRQEDSFLRELLKRDVPKTGKFSTVSQDSVTTERYKRATGESIFTLENGELRTETEKMKDGRILTRTWQDGTVTTLTLTGSSRTALVLLDNNGAFIHKIVTLKGKKSPDCYAYRKNRPQRLPSEKCLGLIPAFD